MKIIVMTPSNTSESEYTESECSYIVGEELEQEAQQERRTRKPPVKLVYNKIGQPSFSVNELVIMFECNDI